MKYQAILLAFLSAFPARRESRAAGQQGNNAQRLCAVTM